MTRTIPTRLSHPKFNQLLEWSRTNSGILQSTDRVELATLAEQQLGFPVSASTFVLIGETMGVTIGRRVVKKEQKASKGDQLSKDMRAMAAVLFTLCPEGSTRAKLMDEIVARLGKAA